ncbi:MAG: hypothetical protein AAF126_00985 [Chloroflexota bacterium]
MAKYHFCSELSYSEIIKTRAISVILALSTRYFAYLQPRLGVNFTYTDQLRLICREFAKQALPTIAISTPEIKVTENDFRQAEFYTMWKQLFVNLNNQKFADAVCSTIVRLYDEENLFRAKVRSPWNSLLAYWALDHFEEESDIQLISSLSLPTDVISEVKILALTNLLWEYRQSRRYRDVIEGDDWDLYVLEKQAIYAWFSNRMRLYRTLSFWIKIFNRLSPEQVTIFDQWGYENIMTNYPNNTTYFSLVELMSKLKNEGYI